MVYDRSTCLVLVLGQQLTGALMRENADADLVVGGRRFRSQGAGYFMGFHDWLRWEGSPGLAGVRWIPHEEELARSMLDLHLPYCRSYEGWGVDVLFSSRAAALVSSGDQAFGFSRLFLSSDRRYALGLDLDGLTLEEVALLGRDLASAPCRWIDAR